MKSDSFKNNRNALAALLLCTENRYNLITSLKTTSDK